MTYLRTLSTRSLGAAIVCLLAIVAAGAAARIGLAGSSPAPPPKPLDEAIHDALTAPAPAGLTARITFTNHLLPASALPGQAASALLAGASGRLWMRNDGTGRIELQADPGDVQVVWGDRRLSVYDASSDTVYRASLPGAVGQDRAASGDQPPTLAEVDRTLAQIGLHWGLGEAAPTDVGGRPAYSVDGSPKADGGLLGVVQVAWDAANGTPLRLGVVAKGHTVPVLGLELHDVAYAPVDARDVALAPPPSATVVDLDTSATSHAGRPPVEGVAAVQSAVGFPLAAPDTLAGLPRVGVKLVGDDTALVVYRRGLDVVAVAEGKAGNASTSSGPLGALRALPDVAIGGATGHELATQLGTVLEWTSGGIDRVLVGTLEPGAAEDAARSLS